MNRRPLLWLFFPVFLAILLSACSTTSALLPINTSQPISPGSSFGQSFTAHNPGLTAISVLLAPSQVSGDGYLNFQLRENLQSPANIARATLPLSDIIQQRYYRFDFPPLKDSERKDYFLQVDLVGNGQIQIFTANGDAYIDGSLYENNNPQDSQLVFRLEYARKAYILGLLPLFVEWIYVVLFGIILFVIPGWGLLSLVWQGWDNLNWPTKLGLSGGLSLALYPLLMLWTNLIGLHLASGYAWLPVLAGATALAWKNRSIWVQLIRKKTPIKTLHFWHKFPPFSLMVPDIALVCIVGLIILSRLWVIRSLDVPLFGDSYQHSMMAQLLVDHGGLFNSWEPYVDLKTFTYHFGFHSLVAVYHWISNASIEQAMLWTGQLINVLAILSLYPLANKITHNRWAGVVTVLIAGLLSPMPMTYVNWGRYTQLAGQVILPVVIWSTITLLETSPQANHDLPWYRKYISGHYLFSSAGNLAVTWLLFSGLALTHYRILILSILFIPAYIILSISKSMYKIQLLRIVWIGAGAAFLFVPWFIHVFGGNILNIFAQQMTTFPSSPVSPGESLQSAGGLQTYLPIYIWVLFLVCTLLGFLKRKKIVAIFILWWLFIVLITNPNWLGLPGVGAITNFTILIAFYIPASVMIGSTVDWLPGLKQPQEENANPLKIHSSGPIITELSLFIIILIIAGWGLKLRVRDIDIRTYALVTRPDLRAMGWIKENTPIDSRFAINSFAAFQNTAIVGSDAGWWIPLLAFRKTTVPPLTYAAEQGNSPNFAQSVHDFYDVIKDNGIISQQTLKLFQAQSVGYIYIGQRQGSVNSPGPPLFDPDLMLSDPHFDLVYHQDRVWIFKINFDNIIRSENPEFLRDFK